MEIEMTNNSTSVARSREIERDAKAWSKFSGMKYTQALRLMEHPLTQGILGDRICARDMIRALTEHPVLSEPVWVTDADGKEFPTDERVTHLGENGLFSADERQLAVGEEDYLRVVLTAEILRAFTRTSDPQSDAFSYNLKHTAEEFLGEYLGKFTYISNGQAIWAAAALGIPLAESNPGELALNADFGLVPEQVDYARRMRRSGGSSRDGIRAHHHRPPGYMFLQQALQKYRDSGETPVRWDGVDAHAEALTSPFHEWLVAQAAPGGDRGARGSLERLAGDYAAGVRDGDHGVARQPEDLLTILHDVGAHEDFFDTARRAVLDWARTSPLSMGIRTELVDWDRSDHAGWGAGTGDVERYEYRCPCGAGTILEEHDNVPGFREHDVRIMCDTCREEWDFVPGFSVRGWRIKPLPAPSAT
ncbi:MAG: hypothetical protein IR160_02040 [Salinibacterium sp.]|nr:hypothetical protein [Salinibacterium sp.]MBF0671348.1 hypothetical protein [Salinibacterium sp.]